MKTFSAPEQRFLWGTLLAFLTLTGAGLFPPTIPRRPPASAGERVNVNAAPYAHLARLECFTPRRAMAVLEARGVAPLADMADLVRAADLTDSEEHTLVALVSFGPAPALAQLPLETCTTGELAAIPGIGKAIARRIVAERDARGGTLGVDDLADIRGLGPARRRLLSAVSLGQPQD